MGGVLELGLYLGNVYPCAARQDWSEAFELLALLVLVVDLLEAREDDPQEAMLSETTAKAITFFLLRIVCDGIFGFAGLRMKNIFIIGRSLFVYSLLKASIGDSRAALLAG